MANECLAQFNERSTVTVTATFIDESGTEVEPDAATYRIDDEASRTSIQPATTISPLGESVDLVITSDQNFIVKSRNQSEIRTVTVEWDYTSDNGPAHGTAQYRYKLVNLYGVVDVASASVSPSASASPSA
jgi:hypothetical protein